MVVRISNLKVQLKHREKDRNSGMMPIIFSISPKLLVCILTVFRSVIFSPLFSPFTITSPIFSLIFTTSERLSMDFKTNEQKVWLSSLVFYSSVLIIVTSNTDNNRKLNLRSITHGQKQGGRTLKSAPLWWLSARPK